MRFWIGTTYFLEGLPFSIVRNISAVFFKNAGISLQTIGLTSLYGIPWTIRFLWAPWIDVTLTKRKWIVFLEVALAITTLMLAFATYLPHFVSYVAVFFLIIAFLSATHDVAIDGFYLQALTPNDQAKFSGIRIAVYRLAMLFGSGVLVIMAGKTNWAVAFVIAAILFFAGSLFHQLKLPHPNSDQKIKSERLKFADAFKSFVMPRSDMGGMGKAIAFILLFKLGDNFLYSMAPPFLLDSGMTTTELGFFSGTLASGGLMLGAILGGWLISKKGLRWGLWRLGLLQNLSLPVYIAAAAYRPAVYVLGGVHCFEYFVAGLGTAAYSNYIMRICKAEYRASHYAVATGFMALSLLLAGPISGYIAQHLGYIWFFAITFLATIPGIALLPAITKSLKY